MRNLLILGGGTAGTITANRLVRQLDPHEWQITVVDRDDSHVYQPGLLFLPFAEKSANRLVRSRRRVLHPGVDLIIGDAESIRPEERRVELANARHLDYDYLVVATGVSPRPSETPGMEGPGWRQTIFDFYTPEGAEALASALRDFSGGRLVVHVAETPVKCPVAPLEFAFLADSALRRRGIRDRVDITYVTPQSGAFTRPVASKVLGSLLDSRGIGLESDFVVERVEGGEHALVSYDERRVDYDLLVTIPVNMGADVIGRSGLGNELNCIPVDHGTLQSAEHPEIFALGDAAELPTSKAGSVAHFQAHVFAENFVELVAGRPMRARFDGHANCFVETGRSRAVLIDFNYDVEPLPGVYPLPWVGPLSLLKESRVNHAGKLGFEWLYWNVLLPGHRLPVPTQLSMAGKRPAA